MQPKLLAVSNAASFVNPNTPLYPRLAQGKYWDEVSLCYYDSVLFFFMELWMWIPKPETESLYAFYMWNQVSKKFSCNFLQMTVTWTSGYNIIEAVPFVEWGLKGEAQIQSPAGTLTFHRESMCGMDPMINLIWTARPTESILNYELGILSHTCQINKCNRVLVICSSTSSNSRLAWSWFLPHKFSKKFVAKFIVCILNFRF